MRIKGIGEDYAGLLEAAGVDTVKELTYRNPANLAKAMAAANTKRKLVRLLPSREVGRALDRDTPRSCRSRSAIDPRRST